MAGSVAAIQPLLEELRTASYPAALRDLQELSYQEIATRLQLPEGTVKSTLHRARSILRKELS